MTSRTEAGKKSRNDSDKGKLINEIDTITKALYLEKNPSRSSASSSTIVRKKSIGSSDRLHSISKPKQHGIGGDFEHTAKDKKSNWWTKPLKALSQVRSRRFNCCFTLEVHTIDGLPSVFNGSALFVHWKRRDGELVVGPVKVFEGVAEFEEKLAHTCSVHGTRNGPHHSAKYSAKHFWLYVSVDGHVGLDLGKHGIDVTKLLPLTFEELEEEKSSGKWTTSYKLQGKAAGAVMNVSFGYVLLGDNPSMPPNNKNVLELLSSKQNKVDDYWSRIPRSESLPQDNRPFDATSRSVDDIRVLHEVLPATNMDLSHSLNKLDIMLEEEKLDPSFNDEPGVDVSVDKYEPAELSFRRTDSFKENVVCGNADLQSVEKVLESSIEEKAPIPCNWFTTATNDSEVESRVISTACSNIGASVEGEPISHLHTSPGSNIKSIICDGNFIEKDACTKESILEELEFALNDVVDLEKEGLDTPEAKSELGDLENYVEGKSNSVDMSLSLEDLESAENEFLSLLGVEEEEGDPESPRERLLRDFEREAEFNGYPLFGSFVEEEEEYNAPKVREWESFSDYFELPSTFELREEHYIASQLGTSDASTSRLENFADDFELPSVGEMIEDHESASQAAGWRPRAKVLEDLESEALMREWGLNEKTFESSPPDCAADDFELPSVGEMIEDHESASQAAGWRPRAKVLEDLESEALMREWGLNEKTFESSPPDCAAALGSSSELTHQDPHMLPALGEGLGPFVQTKNGGFLRSMNPDLFRNSKSGGRLIMQVSSPVVVPAEMGSGVMEMLENLASLGLERLSAQANKLMPLEDITGKTMQQISWEAAPQMETNDRQDLLQHESNPGPVASGGHKKSKRRSSRLRSRASSSSTSEYVNLEDLAPLAMDKIEAVSIEGLKIQSGMSEEEAPLSIRPNSLGVEGAVGLQLLDVKDNSAAVDGLMGLSLTLDEWMRMDSGEIDEDEMKNERTSKILAAHHASCADLTFLGRKGDQKSSKGHSGKCGLLGNNFTVALMVQLRDPLRDYEPVGTPMLALIQVERVFVPPKPKVYSTVSEAKKNEKNDDDDDNEDQETVKTPKLDLEEDIKEEKVREEDLIPQYKVAEVHVTGLKTELGKKKPWGSASQQQSGSRWLLANGMGKAIKQQPVLKSKSGAAAAVGKSSSQPTIIAQSGDTLWSISTKIHGTGSKWKELVALNPHIRNPNVIIPTGTVFRIR